MKKKETKTYGERRAVLWYVTAAFICFMPPVGAALLVANGVYELLRQTERVPVILHGGVAAVLFGATMLGAMGIGTILGDTDYLSTLFLVYAPAVVLGLCMVLLYAGLKKRTQLMEKCAMLVLREHITDTGRIGEIVGRSEAKTCRALERAIRLGLLQDAWVDRAAREVRFRRSLWARQRVECDSCGAALVVNLGQTLTCEYCGGALRPVGRRSRGAAEQRQTVS